MSKGLRGRTLTPSWMPPWSLGYGQSRSRAWTSRWGTGSSCPWSAPGRTLGTTAGKGHSTAAAFLEGFKDTMLPSMSRKRFSRMIQEGLYAWCQLLCAQPWAMQRGHERGGVTRHPAQGTRPARVWLQVQLHGPCTFRAVSILLPVRTSSISPQQD